MRIVRLEEITSLPDEPKELSPDELKQAYALARAAFSAQDLQRYTEVDEGVPADDVLAEMERMGEQDGKATS